MPRREVTHGPARVARMPGDVDDGIPRLAGDRGQTVVEVTVGRDEGGTGRWFGAPARQAGDAVATT